VDNIPPENKDFMAQANRFILILATHLHLYESCHIWWTLCASCSIRHKMRAQMMTFQSIMKKIYMKVTLILWTVRSVRD